MRTTGNRKMTGKSNHDGLKLLVAIVAIPIVIAILRVSVNAYSQHKNQETKAARQELAAEVEKMDLSPYCKEYITRLAVAKTDFDGAIGGGNHNKLRHSNSVTIRGTAEGTEELSHKQVFDYMYASITELGDDIDSMFENSLYLQHLNKGDALEHGKRVYQYRNDVYFYLRDSKNEYFVSLDYPREDTVVEVFQVKGIAKENYGEKWSYILKEKNGKYVIDYSDHTDSDAVQAEKKRKANARSGNKSDLGNSSTSGLSSGSSSRSSTKRNSGGTYKKRDTYNSSRYKNAESFAEDYYEDFYDYDDYEDDDDAYDAAVDYWNEWND